MEQTMGEVSNHYNKYYKVAQEDWIPQLKLFSPPRCTTTKCKHKYVLFGWDTFLLHHVWW